MWAKGRQWWILLKGLLGPRNRNDRVGDLGLF